MFDSAFLVVVVSATFLLAGAIKGVLGMGLPTVAMGLLSVVMAPAKAAAILVIPTLITKIWQMAAGPTLIAIRRRLPPSAFRGWFFIGLLALGGYMFLRGVRLA